MFIARTNLIRALREISCVSVDRVLPILKGRSTKSHEISQTPLLLLSNAVQILRSAYENLPVGNCR
jgi:hypothetical protein